MKILYFVHWFWPHIGGMETLSMNAIPHLKKRGHNIIVVTSTSQIATAPKDEYQGIPIYRLPMYDALQQRDVKMFLYVQKELIKIHKEFEPELIHLHFGGMPVGIFLPNISKESKHQTPIVLTLHAGISGLRAGSDTLMGKLLRRSTQIVAVSNSVMNSALKTLPDIKNKIIRIYNGVPTPQVSPDILNFSTPKILCIGRMVKEKGFDIMLEAFRTILQKHPQARLILAGDGPVKKELETLATEYGIFDNVSFLGWVSPERVPTLINRSTIVVVPSRWEEPFGLVAIEAALLQRPVIASKVGGLKEIVQDNSTGLFFNKENSNELAQKVSFLLSNPEVAKKFGITGQKYAQEHFLMDKYIDRYHELYTDLCGKKI